MIPLSTLEGGIVPLRSTLQMYFEFLETTSWTEHIHHEIWTYLDHVTSGS